MKVALLADIHGNCVALEAVLAELGDVDELVCLGDIAAAGPQPREVVARVRELGCRAVRGNADRWLLEGLPPDTDEGTRRLRELVEWARAELDAADLDYIAKLPETLELAVERVRLLCFHGSPRGDTERLLATTPAEALDEALDGAPAADVLAGGHTHLQLLRRHADRLLVNPGSVGLPVGALTDAGLPGWAEYALLEARGETFELAFRRVPVDAAALVAAAASQPGWAADLHRRITGRNVGATGRRAARS